MKIEKLLAESVTFTAPVRRHSILGRNNSRISKNKIKRRLEGYARFNMEKIMSAGAALELISSLSGVQRRVRQACKKQRRRGRRDEYGTVTVKT